MIQNNREFQQPPPVADPSWPTEEEVAQIERRFWKNVQFFPPLYGADVQMTLFDDDYCKTWNLNRLNDLLQRKLSMHDIVIPGINTPYLYIGSFKSTFCWHTEDLELYSINYMHFGAPKTWYTIPMEHKQKFEKLAESYFPQQRKQCSQFLRHKMTLISPSVLRQNGIRVGRIIQHPGEFVVTSPGAYHGGFNQGFNCAEAVNFATEKWVEIGRNASRCTCITDSVRINMDIFHPDYDPQLGYIRGEEPHDALETLPDPANMPSSGQRRMVPVVKIKFNGNNSTQEQQLESTPNNTTAYISHHVSHLDSVQEQHLPPVRHIVAIPKVLVNPLQHDQKEEHHLPQQQQHHLPQQQRPPHNKLKVRIQLENHQEPVPIDDAYEPEFLDDTDDDDYIDDERAKKVSQAPKKTRTKKKKNAESHGTNTAKAGVATAHRKRQPTVITATRTGGVQKSAKTAPPTTTATLPSLALPNAGRMAGKNAPMVPSRLKPKQGKHPILARYYAMMRSKR